MGYRVSELRKIRSTNVGAEISDVEIVNSFAPIMKKMGAVTKLPMRFQRMIALYLKDMNSVINQMSRVLVHGGRALIIIGDSNLRNVYIRNSVAIQLLAEQHGLSVLEIKRRRIPPGRRYLPPPGPESGRELAKRMRTEVLLSLVKP